MTPVETLLGSGQFTATVPLVGFVRNLFLAALLAYILRDFYIRFGRGVSNRRILSSNFVMITVTTMFIISVVKASLALSLGLVGALSIVRFRTAIKEPEELSYIFMAIAIGLGLGADQVAVTLTAFVFTILIIWFLHSSHHKQDTPPMYLTVSTDRNSTAELTDIATIIKKHCDTASLKRHDESQDAIEGTFVITISNFAKLEALKTELNALSKGMHITFLDSQA